MNSFDTSVEVLYPCPTCGKTYKTSRGMKNHLARHSTVDDFRKDDAVVFQCPVCGKTFKTSKWMQKHSLTHNILAPEVNVTPMEEPAEVCDNMDVDGSLGEDDGDWVLYSLPEEALLGEDEMIELEEVAAYFENEDEEEEERREAQIVGVRSEKKSSANKVKKRTSLKCAKCSKFFYTVEGYITHLNSHAFKEILAVKAPNLDTIVSSSMELFKDSLQEIKQIQTAVGSGPDIAVAAESLLEFSDSESLQPFVNNLCKGLYDSFDPNGLYAMPSDFKSAFIKGSASFLGNEVVREEMCSQLKVIVKPEISCKMLPCIVRVFSRKLLSFMARCMTGESNTFSQMRAVTDQSTTSLDFIQTMYYIGGSNLKSVKRTAYRYKKCNEEWQRVFNIIENNFEPSEGNPAPPEEYRAWTDVQSKGRLLHLSSNALDFFLALGRLVKPLEKLDGSLYTDEVFETACSSYNIVCLWDKIINNCMVRKESFKLLHALCSHFCVTWRSGIIKRRIAELQKSMKASKYGKSGLSFRAAL